MNRTQTNNKLKTALKLTLQLILTAVMILTPASFTGSYAAASADSSATSSTNAANMAAAAAAASNHTSISLAAASSDNTSTSMAAATSSNAAVSSSNVSAAAASSSNVSAAAASSSNVSAAAATNSDCMTAVSSTNSDCMTAVSSTNSDCAAATVSTNAAVKADAASFNHTSTVAVISSSTAVSSGNVSAAASYYFGTASAELAPGEYAIDATLMTASDTTKTSAAASCIEGATITVGTSGTAVIELSLKPIEVMGIKGHAEDWRIYTEPGSTAEWKDLDKSSAATTAADVLSTASYTDSEGKTVSYPSEISFTLPNNSWDGVYVSMFVSAMGSSPNAYLALDYSSASAGDTTYTGSAQVEQFGKYNVDAAVTVSAGKIKAVEISGRDFGGKYAANNKMYLETAIEGMKDKWTGLSASQSNAEEIYSVDAVSGATYSSEAIRDAVMDALGLTWEETVINVPASVEPGKYTVDVSYYTDYVKHYLTDDKISQAALTVSEDGSVLLDLGLFSAASTSQMYILAVDGYYKENDTSSELITDGMEVTMGESDYSDKYFTEGTQVVRGVSLPLAGKLSAEYATRVHMYVPAMNNLNGEISGIEFDHGRFHINASIKVYWDTMRQSQDLSVKAANKTFKAAALKKKARTVAASKLVKVSGAKTKMSYSAAAVDSKSKKALKIKNGRITVKKNTKKGTYRVNITVTAQGNSTYSSASSTITSVIKVK